NRREFIVKPLALAGAAGILGRTDLLFANPPMKTTASGPVLQRTLGKTGFIEMAEKSLKRLQMDHVDILFYHSVDSVEDARSEGPLQALRTLKKEGKTRFIGISTHKTVDVISEAIRLNMFDVVLVTLNYTMAHDNGILGTIERAAKNGIGVIAMKTQAGGSVRPDTHLPKPLPPVSQ